MAIAFAGFVAVPVTEAVGPNASPVNRLAVAQEILDALDTFTISGQQHMIGRIVELLKAHADTDWVETSHWNRRALTSLLGELSSLSRSSFPMVAEFRGRAEGVIALLATPS